MRRPEADEILQSLGLAHLKSLTIFNQLSDKVLIEILQGGTIDQLEKKETITRIDEEAGDFQIVLRGKLAYYKHFRDHYVLTRHFGEGEQLGFDEMIALLKRNGTDVAVEDSLVLNVSSQQFYRLHKKYPGEFGIFMLSLALELSREISVLEDVISHGTGWGGRC